MSFLDRLRPQPRWKHADPAVRSAAVAELTLADTEQQAVLAELAASDPDMRVRRAAIARLTNVGELVTLASRESDEGLRGELVERLVGIAVAPAETDGDAALALQGISD